MKKVSALFMLCLVFLMAFVPAVFAVQDYTELETAASAEITAIIPIALGVLSLTIGIPMAIRIFRRIAR